jgi:hypothetical protein
MLVPKLMSSAFTIKFLLYFVLGSDEPRLWPLLGLTRFLRLLVLFEDDCTSQHSKNQLPYLFDYEQIKFTNYGVRDADISNRERPLMFIIS